MSTRNKKVIQIPLDVADYKVIYNEARKRRLPISTFCKLTIFESIEDCDSNQNNVPDPIESRQLTPVHKKERMRVINEYIRNNVEFNKTLLAERLGVSRTTIYQDIKSIDVYKEILSI